jgi:hypothetical protein
MNRRSRRLCFIGRTALADSLTVWSLRIIDNSDAELPQHLTPRRLDCLAHCLSKLSKASDKDHRTVRCAGTAAGMIINDLAEPLWFRPFSDQIAKDLAAWIFTPCG